MCKTRIACLALVLLSVVSGNAFALSEVALVEWDGVEFYQQDLTYDLAPQPFSQYGLAGVDLPWVFDMAVNVYGYTPPASGRSYLNVATSTGWVVRNLLVDENMMDAGYSGISMMFDLYDCVGPGSTPVTSLQANMVLSDAPKSAFNFNLFSSALFTVTSLENNAEGGGGGGFETRGEDTAHHIDYTGISFPGGGEPSDAVWQPGHENIEQDKMQCGPASVANSLQYLENRFGETHGVIVPHDNIPSLDGEEPNALVNKLQQRMYRYPNKPTSLNNWRRGKVEYIDRNGVTYDGPEGPQQLKLKSWGYGDSGYTAPTNGTVLVDETGKGGMSIIEWIIQELNHGEDVEMFIDLDGQKVGHMVELIGGGHTEGVPWVAWAHDLTQGDNSTGTTQSTGGIGFSYLDGDRYVNFIGYGDGTTSTPKSGDITHALSESVPEPSTLVLAVTALIGLLAYTWHRRKRY